MVLEQTEAEVFFTDGGRPLVGSDHHIARVIIGHVGGDTFDIADEFNIVAHDGVIDDAAVAAKVVADNRSSLAGHVEYVTSEPAIRIVLHLAAWAQDGEEVVPFHAIHGQRFDAQIGDEQPNSVNALFLAITK